MKKLTVLFTLILLAMASFCFVNTAFGASATFIWTPNSEANLAGYKIYSSKTAPGAYDTATDIGSPTIIDGKVVATLTGYVSGVTYYFAATAYDTDGFESDYSEEVIWTPPEDEKLPEQVAENPPSSPDFGTAAGLMVFPATRNADGTYSAAGENGVMFVTMPSN